MKRSTLSVVIAMLFVISGFGIAGAHEGHSMHASPTPDCHCDGHATPTAHGEMSMGAFYFTVSNSGEKNDRLVKVETDVAGAAEIHNVVMKDGAMQMQHQEDGVEIPAGGELKLEPGSYHVMLIGLNKSLLDGEEFKATLTFEHAGVIEVTVPISVGEPKEFAEPVKVGDSLEVSNVWARQAPKLDGMSTPVATPAATPGH